MVIHCNPISSIVITGLGLVIVFGNPTFTRPNHISPKKKKKKKKYKFNLNPLSIPLLFPLFYLRPSPESLFFCSSSLPQFQSAPLYVSVQQKNSLKQWPPRKIPPPPRRPTSLLPLRRPLTPPLIPPPRSLLPLIPLIRVRVFLLADFNFTRF
jgi:hypothetical protein